MSPNEFESTSEIIVEVEKADFFKEMRIKEYRDDYIIKRALKFGALILIIVFGTFLTILIMRETLQNATFRAEVLSTLKYNLGAIFVAIFGFLGIKLAIKSQDR